LINYYESDSYLYATPKIIPTPKKPSPSYLGFDVVPEVVEHTNHAIKLSGLNAETTKVFHGDITEQGFPAVFEEKVKEVFGW
jgi:hypothetical protein